MSIKFSSYPLHLQDSAEIGRAYWKRQENQNGDQKVFHKDTLEVSQLSTLRDRIEHTVVHPVTSFSDMRAGILKGIKEEKGQYDHSDVVNACGLSYARIYSEIEERYKNGNEQYYKSADGTSWTKEEEIEWLDMQYEQEVEWQKACARVAIQGQICRGHIPEMTAKEISGVIEELDECLYQAKDAYMKQHRGNRQNGNPLAMLNFVFGNRHMYEILDSLENQYNFTQILHK